MKHLLEAHWVPGTKWDRRVFKKRPSSKGHLPCIRNFMLIVFNPPSNTSKGVHVLSWQRGKAIFSSSYIYKKKKENWYLILSHPKLQVLPKHHTATLLPHSPSHSFTWSASVPECLLQPRSLRSSVWEDPSPGLRRSLWRSSRRSSLGAVQSLCVASNRIVGFLLIRNSNKFITLIKYTVQ